MDKDADTNSIMMRSFPSVDSQDEANHLADFILVNCEKNEGLQKLYSFHTLESVVTKMKAIDNAEWLDRVAQLLIKNFEYPLNSVVGTCENVMKKLLSLCNREQIEVILNIAKTLSTKHEIKSKYTALNLALDYVNAVDYLQENKD